MKSLTLSVSVSVSVAALCLGAFFPAQASQELAKKHLCATCHVTQGPKTIGPAYADVAKKYANQPDAEAKLISKVKKGGTGVWGQIPMPPNAQVPDADVKTLVKWVLETK